MNSPAKSEQHDISPVSILFICLGNICRSPAADGIMHKLVKDAGLEAIITIDSAGTYGGHAGALPDARMRQHAIRRGYELTHRSRKVGAEDFDRFDMIVAMDDYNYQDLFELAPDREAQQKIYRMTDFSVDLHDDHVPDPYYNGEAGFECVLNILEDACRGLLNALKHKEKP